MWMIVGFIGCLLVLTSPVHSVSEVNVDVIDVTDVIKVAEKVIGASSTYVFKKSDVQFRLYNNVHNGTLMRVNGYDSKMLSRCKTIVLIHGWGESYMSPFNTLITAKYLKKGCYNMIVVDYHPAATAVYSISASLADSIGDVVKSFILNNEIPLDSTRIIGFSLGAQIAGFTGKRIFKEVRCKIAEIIGLDAAGPRFYVNCNKRLCLSDADMVVVFHTDAGFLGTATSIGNLDVFVNGGTALQPNCTCIRNIYKITDPIELFTKVGCSHIAVYAYYADIICDRTMTCTVCHSDLKYKIGLCKGNSKYVFGAEDLTSEMSGKCFAKFPRT